MRGVAGSDEEGSGIDTEADARMDPVCSAMKVGRMVGRTDGEIAEALDVGVATVARVRRCCVEEGLEAALNWREQLNRRAKMPDGETEARLVAIACGGPPAGLCSMVVALARGSTGGVRDRGFRESGDGSAHA